MTDLTADQTNRQRQRARHIDAAPGATIRGWLGAALQDFKANPGLSIAYGASLAVLGWLVVAALAALGLGWMVLPMAAGAMMLGPFATIGLYRVARRRAGLGGGGIAAPGQIFLVSVVMMILALMWIRSAVLLFAVFFGLRPFPGFLETLATLFTTIEGLALVLIGSAVGGLFAAFGFAIAAFSFPMLVHRDIDGFSAMGLSFNASVRNFWLVAAWGAVITAAITLSVATGLLLLIPIFPLLGYATWHAYADLFES